MTLSQLASQVGCSTKHLKRIIPTAYVPYYKTKGGHWRFRKSRKLDQFIADMRQPKARQKITATAYHAGYRAPSPMLCALAAKIDTTIAVNSTTSAYDCFMEFQEQIRKDAVAVGFYLSTKREERRSNAKKLGFKDEKRFWDWHLSKDAELGKTKDQSLKKLRRMGLKDGVKRFTQYQESKGYAEIWRPRLIYRRNAGTKAWRAWLQKNFPELPIATAGKWIRFAIRSESTTKLPSFQAVKASLKCRSKKQTASVCSVFERIAEITRLPATA